MKNAGSCGTAMTGFQGMKNHARPFRREKLHHASGGAILAPFGVVTTCLHVGYPLVPTSHFGAV